MRNYSSCPVTCLHRAVTKTKSKSATSLRFDEHFTYSNFVV
jgi:hypothetical protein